MAMGPIDYYGMQPHEDLTREFLSAAQLGSGLRQMLDQRDAQQAAQQQAQQYAQDVQDALANPTPQAFSSLALKYPTQREAVKQAWDGMSAADQKAEGDTMAQAYAALLAGNKDAAKGVVQAQIDARKNSGLDTSHFDNALSLLDADPKQAQGALGFTLSHISDPKTFAATFGTLQEIPGKMADADATTASKQADNLLKNQQITAQKAGALAKVPGLKQSQVLTFLQSEAAAGRLAPDELETLKATIPTDAKALPDFLSSLAVRGLTPDQNAKLTTPDANAKLSAETSRYGTDSAARTAAARLAFDKDQAAAGDDVANFTPEAIENAAKRYNLDGTLPPMGMGAAASAGRTKILNRAAELAAGIDGTDQRRSQLTTKQTIANQGKAVAAFNTGKEGKAVRSFNVLLSHLDTLDSLSDALNNGNIQLVNRLGNAYNKATGNPAPTNFDSVKHIVADEVIKAITGGAGALGDREESARAINGANSPAQLKGVIENIKRLSVGQLGGLEQQYKASTGLDDFEHYLTPAARLMRAKHGEGGAAASGAPAAPALPAGWSVEVH